MGSRGANRVKATAHHTRGVLRCHRCWRTRSCPTVLIGGANCAHIGPRQRYAKRPVQSALLRPWLARDPVLVAIMLRIIARLITPSRCEPNSARGVTVWRGSKMAQRGHWWERTACHAIGSQSKERRGHCQHRHCVPISMEEPENAVLSAPPHHPALWTGFKGTTDARFDGRAAIAR